ncbi:hypothetical protein HOY80DRAFT_986603 [Tuber brumale]|nr:hypothetical protein HOY80DRAFT_986603 [Tuber brumale]
MYNHRRGRSSSRRPTQPTSAALIAATAVYRPKTSSPDAHLAAAAAGAALRHVTVTPTPPGTIQTKRMLQRRESYSSVTPPSDSEDGPRRVQRSHSTSSLTKRRFRKPKPPPPPSPPVQQQQQQYYQRSGATDTHSRNKGKARGYFPSSSSDDGDSEEDSNIRRSASIRSTGSNLSFPPTLRGPTTSGRKGSKSKHAPPTRSMLSRGSLRDSKPVSPSHSDRFHRRSPEPDLTTQTRRKNQQANGNVYQAEYAESVCSATGSELGSIAEEDGVGTAGRIIRNNVPPRIAEESSEGQDDNKVHEATTSASPTRKGNSQSRRRERSPSPSRTHFSLNTTENTPTKHSPPPRSVSPAKSALKHHPASPPPVPPVPANAHLDNSPSSPSGRKTRVSFSDEDSVASFIHGRAPISAADSAAPPTPPVSGSIRRTGRGAPQNGNAKNTTNKSLPSAIYSISPPPSSSSQEDLRLEYQRAGMADSPDGRLGHTPPETSPSSSVLGRPIPEVVVVIPTPLEKGENEAMGSAIQTLDGFPAGESSSANAAALAREDSYNDSDGASIYSDAYENLEESAVPSIMQVADSQEAPSPLPHVPHTQPQPSTTNPPDPQNGTQTTNPPNPQNGTQTPQTKPTKSHKRESPPLPPDFIPGCTSTISPSSSRRRPQSPIRTHSTSSSSSDTASITSISSFKRVHPRQPRTGMRSTMRSDSPPSAPCDPHQKPAPLRNQKPKRMKSTLRGTSRIPDLSDEDEEYQQPALQSCFADSDDEDFAIGPGAGGKGKLRKRPNRGAFSKKEKDNVGKVKNGFWGRFGKRKEKEKKDKPKGKEPGVTGSRSEGAASAVAAVVEVPDATVNNVALGSRAIRKQKTRAGPGMKPVSVRTEGPPPRVKEKKGWRKLFSNG